MQQEQGSYEFDPCALDGSDKDEVVTLDNWKPSAPKSEIVPSEWRQNQIGKNFNQQPGIDEFNKIKMHLSKKVSDGEILKTFGITVETLLAIKRGDYHPAMGITFDIYKEVPLLIKRVKKLEEKLDTFLTSLFDFSSEIEKIKPAKPKKKYAVKSKEPTEKKEKAPVKKAKKKD